MKKNLLIYLLIFAMVFTSVGCESKQEKPEEANVSENKIEDGTYEGKG